MLNYDFSPSKFNFVFSEQMDFFEENEIVVKTNFIEQLKYMTIVLLRL